MTVPYELTGRVSQKSRTRQALVDAVRGLLAEGITPTMEGAASAAAISRTTAYRYFADLRELLAAAYPHIDETSLLGSHAPDDPMERLAMVAESQTRRILEYEQEMRAVLRLSLEKPNGDASRLPMNRGLRIGWIRDALSPLNGKLPRRDLERLVLGIGATLGIEVFVWLRDIAGVEPQEAATIMQRNAVALLGWALDSPKPPSPAG
ncbi:MAG: TetR/AcrR family transcriptional regulator [Actinomycetota bacterium]